MRDPIIDQYSFYSALIPNTSPVLGSTALVIKVESTESTVFVNPTDVYTVTHAITALQNRLSAVSNIFTVTQDVNTKRIKVAKNRNRHNIFLSTLVQVSKYTEFSTGNF